MPNTFRTLGLCASAVAFALSGCSNSGNTITNETTDESDAELVCPVGSLYDEEEDVCYIDCDGLTDEQCDDLDQAVFGDFDDFIDDGFTGPGTDNQAMLSEERAIATYAIGSDLQLTSLENTQPESDDQFRQIWDSAQKLLPTAVLSETLSEYQVSTDGVGETLAFVEPDDNQSGKWIIAFDNADYKDGKDTEFVHTTVHEFGHIVFLRDGQVDMSVLGDCPNYAIMEGCTATDSFINQFYQQFWASIFDEHAAAVAQGEESDALYAFYEKYQDQFVSDYAATNPVEDAAEVFTRFVLVNKPAAGGPITQQKIRFLHRFDELVKLRGIIRGKLNSTRS